MMPDCIVTHVDSYTKADLMKWKPVNSKRCFYVISTKSSPDMSKMVRQMTGDFSAFYRASGGGKVSHFILYQIDCENRDYVTEDLRQQMKV